MRGNWDLLVQSICHGKYSGTEFLFLVPEGNVRIYERASCLGKGMLKLRQRLDGREELVY
jgi:hypothetical protein